MRSTSELRVIWGPPCRTHDSGVLKEAYKALDQVFHNWKYAPDSGSGGYCCRRITNGDGYSLHSYKDGGTFTFWNGRLVYTAVAVDISPSKNPYGSHLVTDMDQKMIDEIEAIRTKSGAQVWQWGGDWNGNNRRDDSPYDAMHFQVQATPAELRTGINWNTVPGTQPPPPKPLPHQEIKVKSVEISLILPTLQIGAKGEAVRRLQDILVKYCGQKSVKVSGAYDSYTQQGVNNVKRLMNSAAGPDVPLDGICGPRVWEFLTVVVFGEHQIED